MAAFSSQQLHHPFPLESSFFSPTNKVSAFLEDPNMENFINSCFSHFNPPGNNASLQLQTSAVDPSFQENSYSYKAGQSTDSSTVVDRLEAGEQVSQKLNNTLEVKKRKSSNSAQSKGQRESKSKKQKKGQTEMKGEEKLEANKADKKGQKKVPNEEAPKGYIHVRARRGQATDSHSLAERVRREKISERMKILQGLVPGCDKVTGKALMLDEIINYVQSLQNQVEFLSMKLASVNPIVYDFGMDAFMLRQEVLNSLESPLPSLQQYSSPNQSTALPDATTRTTLTSTPPNNINFSLVDPSTASFLLHQDQRLISANISHQDNASVLWDVDEQRQKFLNTSVFGNNLCSDFH